MIGTGNRILAEIARMQSAVEELNFESSTVKAMRNLGLPSGISYGDLNFASAFGNHLEADIRKITEAQELREQAFLSLPGGLKFSTIDDILPAAFREPTLGSAVTTALSTYENAFADSLQALEELRRSSYSMPSLERQLIEIVGSLPTDQVGQAFALSASLIGDFDGFSQNVSEVEEAGQRNFLVQMLLQAFALFGENSAESLKKLDIITLLMIAATIYALLPADGYTGADRVRDEDAAKVVSDLKQMAELQHAERRKIDAIANLPLTEVTSSYANLRSEPTGKAPLLFRVKRGTMLALGSAHGPWSRVFFAHPVTDEPVGAWVWAGSVAVISEGEQ